MVEIANRLPDISAAARDRLDRAMATIKPVDFVPERLSELLAKRDELLALADSSKLTHAATGAA